MKSRASRVTLLVLAIVAMVGLVLQVGSVPHLHASQHAGFFNQEHDLTLLAGLASHGIPAESSPTVLPTEIPIPLVQCVPERPALQLAFSGDSRAPPLR